MSKKRTAAALSASAVSALLVGGAVLAPSAFATDTQSSAYGIAADGIIDIAKTPDVVGSGKASFVAADLPDNARPLLHAGVLNAEAGKGWANANVAEVGLSLNALGDLGGRLDGQRFDIEAELIEANCEDLRGSTSVVNLRVGGEKIELDHIKPNTELIPEPLEGIARLTLNKQVKHDDQLTVTAVSVELLKGSKLLGQNIDIASATCGEKPEDTEEPTDPTDPSDPTDPNDPGDDNPGDDNPGDGDNGDDNTGGDEADENGHAPVPTPQPAHLDVTG
jgi:hypothetical protein